MNALAELFRVYILEPMGNQNRGLNFVCKDQSQWTELEIKNQVLSLYGYSAEIKSFSNTVFSNRLFSRHNERTWFHAIWHGDLNRQIKESHQHWHRSDFNEISPEDLKTLMNYLNAFHQQNKLCEDGKTNCLLTDADRDAFLAVQKDFFEYQNKQGLKTVYQHLQDLTISGVRGLLHGFLGTLWQVYLKPYLIYHKQFSKTKVDVFSKALLGLVDLCVSPTFLNASMALVLREGLGLVLERMECADIVRSELVMAVSSVIASASDPLSLMNLACSGGGVLFGKGLAHRIILELPKLKTEPLVEATRNAQFFQEGSAQVLGQGSAVQPEGLRQRRVNGAS